MKHWIPAFAGMTEKFAGMTKKFAGMTEKFAGMKENSIPNFSIENRNPLFHRGSSGFLLSQE
jgi:hypothetical protein